MDADRSTPITRPVVLNLLKPGEKCFHCGTALVPGTTYCAKCGNALTLSGPEEQGHIAYLIRAFEGFVESRQIDSSVADRLTLPFRERLGVGPFTQEGGHLAAPVGVSVPVPQGAPALPGVVRPPTAPRVAGPRPSFAVIWANVLLYLGAFFVVIASIVFIAAFPGWGRTIITAILAVMFLSVGLVCRRIAMVKSAGDIFTGLGALIVPLVFLGVISTLEKSGPLTTDEIWFAASISCFLLYTFFAVVGLGRFYAALSMVAAAGAFWSVYAIADWDIEWASAWFALQAFLFTVGHYGAKRVVPRLYGVWPLVAGVTWSVFAGLFYIPTFFEDDRAPALWPMALVAFTYIVIAWRAKDPLSPLIASSTLAGAIIVFNGWLEGTKWSGALAVLVLAACYLGFWRWKRHTLAGREVFAVGAFLATVTPLIPFYERQDGTGAIVGFTAVAVLILMAALTRTGALLALPAVVGGVGWWYALGYFFPNANQPDRLGVAYLPVVTVLVIAAMAFPMRAFRARWTLAIAAGVYAVFCALVSGPGAQSWAIVTGAVALLSVALTARWRLSWLLPVTASWLGLALLGLLRWLDVPRETLPLGLMLLALTFTGVGFAVIGLAPRWSMMSRLSGIGLNVAACLLGMIIVGLRSSRFGYEELTGHLVGVIFVTIAGQVALEATRRPLLWYASSAVALAAVLWEIDAFGATNLQWFAVPLGLYLLIVSLIAAKDSRLGEAARPLSGIGLFAATAVFGLASFIQTFSRESWTYEILLFLEGLALLILVFFVRRRSLLAGSITMIVVAGIRVMFEVPEFTPFLLFFGGFGLIGGGFFALLVFTMRAKGKVAPPAEPAAVEATPPSGAESPRAPE